ncbi:MAG: LysR family transcriptional regulator [Maritimibacter sp.]|nr:LysR family transcriptional regulator [Maritimibacter sp.]
MNLPSLRQLRFLVALADELHFGRAAEACFVTQSTLSTGLKELEALLGAPLAERTKRSVMLTPLGVEIAERARAVLMDVGEIVELAKHGQGVLGGPLRLGTIPTIGPYLFPRIMPQLRTAFPDLKLYLREELTESLIAGLRAGRLDVILIALPFDIGDLAWSSLFLDGYQLASSLDHPLAGRGPVHGADLDDERLLLLERGHCLQRHALAAFPDSGAVQDDSFSATSLATLVAMVAEGLGITLLPQLVIDAGAVRGQELALTPLDGAWPREVILAWRKASVRAAEYEALAAVLRAERARLNV